MRTSSDFDVIVGVNSILEKLKTSPSEISEILFARGTLRPILKLIESQARNLKIKTDSVGAKELDACSRGQKHQGVLARVQAYSYGSFAQLEETFRSGTSPQRVLILDGITDPRNFGAILRTAEAAGIHDVVIAKDRSVGITPTVVKASAGAVSHLRIYRVVNLRRALSFLKNHGFWIVGLDATAEEVYDRKDYPENLGIVLGSEGRGMRSSIAQECDYRVRIPMKGKISTLNVSVAGAILLYEILRQEQH